MATYYVRTSGSAAADGLTPETALSHPKDAVSKVAAGDTVYIGGGTYRGGTISLLNAASGTSGSPIRWIGDIGGAHTGDPGPAVIDAYLSSGSRYNGIVYTQEKMFHEWYNLTFQGAGYCVYGSISTNYTLQGWVFERCCFVTEVDDYAIYANFNQGTQTPGLRVRRCMFTGGGIRLQWDANETADVDLDVSITDNIFIGMGGRGYEHYAFGWDRASFGTYSSIGAEFHNNTVIGQEMGVFADNGEVTAYNNYISASYGFYSQSANIISDYNTIIADTAYVSVTAGTNDSIGKGKSLFGGIADKPLRAKLGWSPYKPWEPIQLLDRADLNEIVGTTAARASGSVDYYGQLISKDLNRGAVQMNDQARKETSTTYSGSNAIRFEGEGYQDLLIPVEANTEVTVTVQARYNSNYVAVLNTEQKPSLFVYGEVLGATDTEDEMTVAANTWEQLTSGPLSILANGLLKVRLYSGHDRSADAAGRCYFDDLKVRVE